MPSRRHFLATTAGIAATVAGNAAARAGSTDGDNPRVTEVSDLCGAWQFKIDPNDDGHRQRWFTGDYATADARIVNVPHTWQIEPALADYYGVAWYQRSFNAHASWAGCVVRLQFEAVFHTATIWVNGELAGKHARKGYTAFAMDITHLIRLKKENSIVVRVNNAFDDHMLPRGHSSDWAPDGGIYRPVQLLITPRTFIEQVDLEALPDFAGDNGKLTIVAHLRNGHSKAWLGEFRCQVVERASGANLPGCVGAGRVSLGPQTMLTHRLEVNIANPKLWHFDAPHLYRLDCWLTGADGNHHVTELFGVRRLEVKNGMLHLNGEQVRLMGVERMPGSNPELGMAESEDWVQRNHEDLKNLNCVFTRTHWPQDRRVLDFCDHHGILMQCEVPAWGSGTFKNMGTEPDADIMQNGLEQLQEMIARDRNHPSVVAWGLCNEIAGRDPADYHFAKRMLYEAKRLDPNRLVSYASNTLFNTPQRDVAGLMDIIETNEYFGSWQSGSTLELDQHLEQLHVLFPDKPIVISEYGYCACTPDRPEGDEHRIKILESHNVVIRSKSFVGGSIFFCYNDYRTHVGDRGAGALRQRVHGVVDVYGAKKPSYEVLRRESSPISNLVVLNRGNTFHLKVRSRHDTPRYTLRGYRLRGVCYGQGGIPEEQQEIALPEIAPGAEVTTELTFSQRNVPLRVRFDVIRPTRFSTYSLEWNRSTEPLAASS